MPKLSQIKKGIRNPKKACQYMLSSMHPIHPLENLYLFFTSRYPIGTHVFELEWDILVILDTCRVDAMRAVSQDYDFISNVNKIWSLGGTSPEWIAHTFDERYADELEDTAYITANPHAETVLENQNMDKRKYTAAARRFYRYGSWNQVGTGDLGLYDPVFSYTSGINLENEDKIDDVTPPRHITDRTISAMRKNDFDRVICHYMQPHYPWISGAIQEEREVQEYERNPVKVKKFGKKKVFNAYLDDLRYVLDDIRLLLNNVDAGEVAISADHGDAFGEYGIFGHDPGRFHPQVRFVPWVTTTAVDKNEYEPKITPQSRRQTSVDDQLEALGYH